MALSFGVEIELLVCPRNGSTFNGFMSQTGWDAQTDSIDPLSPPNMIPPDVLKKRDQNRYSLRFAIAAALSAVGIPAIPEHTADYESWTILDEESLDEIPRYWRVELVSRVLATNTNWRDELEAVFSVLHRECRIRLTNGCSMHVHVSPYDNTYNAEQLRRICKGLCYFDDAIMRVMPAERKDNPWAMSNVVGRGRMVNTKLKRAYSLVPNQSWAPVFKMLDKVTPKLVHHSLSGDRERRYLSWNFENVTQPCGTVEFRRPPGVDSAAQASHWAAFTLGFVAQAMAEDDWDRLKSRNTVGAIAELHSFIVQGLLILGPNCSGVLNKAKMVEDTSPPLVPNPAELELIERKMKAKDKTKNPFVEKASSRPNTPTLASAQLAIDSV